MRSRDDAAAGYELVAAICLIFGVLLAALRFRGREEIGYIAETLLEIASVSLLVVGTLAVERWRLSRARGARVPDPLLPRALPAFATFGAVSGALFFAAYL